jgi:hypothetical protein
LLPFLLAKKNDVEHRFFAPCGRFRRREGITIPLFFILVKGEAGLAGNIPWDPKAFALSGGDGGFGGKNSVLEVRWPVRHNEKRRGSFVPAFPAA